ncbi:MAG: type II toxin-antitoxin system HicA family toxin [Verrucomicrobia bacterium]|nr:type II toxin-antitoxin system HicA family toxin [Verrucomicrobiota bacterium]
MKRGHLLRYLISRDCSLYREGGKHSIWIYPATRKVATIPRHQEISKFVVKKICEQLGVPPPP